MISAENPEIEVDKMMSRIREEVVLCKGRTNLSSRPSYPSAQVSQGGADKDSVVDTVSLTRVAEGTEVLPYKKDYVLSDFLNFHDETFIRNAYRGILRREPDNSGFAYYLTALREARFTKIEIMGRLRFSPEGRMQAVRIKRLILPFAVRTASRLPVIGYLVALGNILLRLPVVVKNWERHEAAVQHQQLVYCRQVNMLASEVEAAFHGMQHSVSAIDEKTAHMLAELQQRVSDSDEKTARMFVSLQQDFVSRGEVESKMLNQMQSLKNEIEGKADNWQFTELNDFVTDNTRAIDANFQEIRRQILDQKRNILDQQRRLALLLEEARKRLPEKISVEQLQNMLSEEDHLLDAFYVGFEDRFRGTREDIKKRLEVYLPIITEAKAGAEEAAILDIGCGRGEFLEILEAHQLVVQGVDMNRIMVNQSKEMGLNVQEGEAIACLQALKPNTLGAITGIHIIEHLPLRRLITLFDEALRVLRPGGVVIFETPNPENIIVGACNFYYDPTHLNPLPPIPMQFLLEARGFSRVVILRLQRTDASEALSEGSERLREIVNGAFFSAQDYALIGYKA